MARASPTPVHLVTGFLGSGKTTLIGALLRDPALRDTAVIVNERGAVGLDHALLEMANDDVVLLPQGCLCCALSGTLEATLEGLDARRISGDVPGFARVVIEASGAADPLPILRSLLDRPMLLRGYAAGRVIATVDAVVGQATLARHAEAARQVALADRLVITKTDLAPDFVELCAELVARNALAEHLVAVQGAIGADALLDGPPVQRRRFLAEAVPAAHVGKIASLCLEFPDPLPFAALSAWLQLLVAEHGPALLRIKGVLRLQGQEKPLLVQGAQNVFHPPVLLDAWPAGLEAPVLVVITDQLDPMEVLHSARRARLRCKVAG